MTRRRHPGPACGRVARWLLLAAIPLWPAADAAAQEPLKTFTVTPCRILDTRSAVPAGPIPAGTTRAIRVSGDLGGQGGASDCGIPPSANCFVGCLSGTMGVYINVVAVGAEGDGHVSVFPYFSANRGSTLNFSRGQTVANGVFVRICLVGKSNPCPYDLNVTMGPAAAHVVIDVTGYAYFDTGP